MRPQGSREANGGDKGDGPKPLRTVLSTRHDPSMSIAKDPLPPLLPDANWFMPRYLPPTPVWRIARVEDDRDLTPVEDAPKTPEYEDDDFA